MIGGIRIGDITDAVLLERNAELREQLAHGIDIRDREIARLREVVDEMQDSIEFLSRVTPTPRVRKGLLHNRVLADMLDQREARRMKNFNEETLYPI